MLLCSCGTPGWTAKFWDITDVKSGKVPNMLSEYMEINIIHYRTKLDFVLENVNRK
jgi:hypothetical protein